MEQLEAAVASDVGRIGRTLLTMRAHAQRVSIESFHYHREPMIFVCAYFVVQGC